MFSKNATQYSNDIPKKYHFCYIYCPKNVEKYLNGIAKNNIATYVVPKAKGKLLVSYVVPKKIAQKYFKLKLDYKQRTVYMVLNISALK